MFSYSNSTIPERQTPQPRPSREPLTLNPSSLSNLQNELEKKKNPSETRLPELFPGGSFGQSASDDAFFSLFLNHHNIKKLRARECVWRWPICRWHKPDASDIGVLFLAVRTGQRWRTNQAAVLSHCSDCFLNYGLWLPVHTWTENSCFVCEGCFTQKKYDIGESTQQQILPDA